MKRLTILVIVLVFLAVFSFAIYSYLTNKDINYYLDIGRFDEPTANNNQNTDDGSELANIAGGASGTTTSSGGGGGGGDAVTEEPLPDFESASCGIYFSEYGVCSGTCPSGTCVSEGRSCYCKK